MKERGLLKSQIFKAWKQCINKDYLDQRINSESGLLVFFCFHLKGILSKNRRIFIEPEITITVRGNVKKIIPDIVICNTREVIGIIELKYLPRVHPQFSKDINSLSMLAKHRGGIKISNKRFRGKPVDNTIYTFSKNILFVWAGVHTVPDLKIPIDNALTGCFLELHALTIDNGNPKIYRGSQ